MIRKDRSIVKIIIFFNRLVKIINIVLHDNRVKITLIMLNVIYQDNYIVIVSLIFILYFNNIVGTL